MMDWRKIFGSDKKNNTASTAKERLMVVVAHQREGRGGSAAPYLPQLREEILAVVRKYVSVPDTSVQVQVQQKDGLEVIEMDITLPEDKRLSL
ncbi:cell division topological specificity factor MinE [Agitococcus lubricus]|uniref:Cell division topological specificity factor n=1 Tax=Agitococcus lubricus TaxID=1077255 RepID=A0A2T5IWJ3_9GAMM|nr:cell division topological specificity factor MinE [Agitococcus lubricus]PTQ88288.1 cell division topological specificity factor MinE [Agitococcus lubricus]